MQVSMRVSCGFPASPSWVTCAIGGFPAGFPWVSRRFLASFLRVSCRLLGGLWLMGCFSAGFHAGFLQNPRGLTVPRRWASSVSI